MVINLLSLCEVIDVIYRSLNLLTSFLTLASRQSTKSNHILQFVPYWPTSLL